MSAKVNFLTTSQQNIHEFKSVDNAVVPSEFESWRKPENPVGFSLSTPVSSTHIINCHHVAEILLKVALNTKNHNPVILDRFIMLQDKYNILPCLCIENAFACVFAGDRNASIISWTASVVKWLMCFPRSGQAKDRYNRQLTFSRHDTPTTVRPDSYN